MLLGAVLSETKHGWVLVLRKTHPASHGVDDGLVPVDSGVGSLNPVVAISGIVAAGAVVEGLGLLHGLGAAAALVSDAVVAIRATVWETGGSVVHEGVGREEGLDLPVSVGSGEELGLEVSVHLDVLVLDVNGTLVAHISGRGAWVLVIVAVVLSDESLGGDLPRAALWELLWIGGLPDLDLVDVGVTETSGLHLVLEGLAEVVNAVIAHEHLHLTAEDDLEVGDEIVWQVSGSHVVLEDLQDVGDGVWVDVLGSVHSEARETDTQEISHVGGDSVSDVVRFGIEVGETDEPSVVEDEGVGPGVEGSLAVEVGGDVGSVGVLHAWLDSGVVGLLVHEVLSEEWRSAGGFLWTPVGATTSVAISVALPDVVTSASHVVDDGIGVDSDALASAGLDHVSELLSGSASAVELVGSGLVDEEPWVELAVLRPLVGEEGLLWWEDFDAHVAGLGQEVALLGDVVVWPSEELNDGSLLTVLVVVSLLNLSILPDKVSWLSSDGKLFAVSIGDLDSQSELLHQTGVGLVGTLGLEALVVPVVLDLLNTVMLSALSLDGSRLFVGSVNDFVVAHDSAQTLILVLVHMSIRSVLEESLEGSLGPVVWVSGLLSASASSLAVEVGAIVVNGSMVTMTASMVGGFDAHHGRSSCEFGEHYF